MSVQSEITRLETAKTNIVTAITNKGVTVPSGTKLDGMAALIRSIESGGGVGVDIPTCTIEFSGYVTSIDQNGYLATVFKNGEVKTVFKNNIADSKTIVENVVCGTVFYACGKKILSYVLSGGVERPDYLNLPAYLRGPSLSRCIFIAPTTPGAVGTIKLVED